ncbi:MAG TPA: hypothetical protein VFU31_04880, partial [Candidatus Binatia bacterium]|nr:hypothetical protein [Candidatus Binatia bacterium]
DFRSRKKPRLISGGILDQGNLKHYDSRKACPERSRRDAKTAGYKPNDKFESQIPNSKQFQMMKNQKLLNKPVSDFVIGICFGFRYSIFDFDSLASWRDKISFEILGEGSIHGRSRHC